MALWVHSSSSFVKTGYVGRVASVSSHAHLAESDLALVAGIGDGRINGPISDARA